MTNIDTFDTFANNVNYLAKTNDTFLSTSKPIVQEFQFESQFD